MSAPLLFMSTSRSLCAAAIDRNRDSTAAIVGVAGGAGAGGVAGGGANGGVAGGNTGAAAPKRRDNHMVGGFG
jgi:hypothetical protein